MSDSFTMGGLVRRYEVCEAVVKAIEAGLDLILLKDENQLRQEVHASLIEAVRSGRIRESRLEESIRRVLSMKWDYGLFPGEGGSRRAQIASVLTDPGPRHLEEEAARRSLVLLRDQARLLPLSPDKKILLVEDIATIQLAINDRWCHPGMMWEAMLEHDPGVMMV